MTGPFKATDEQIAAARKRKPETSEPIPDDYFLNPEESQEVTIKRYHDRIKNPMTAIRAFCVQCMGGYVGEVAKCTSPNCALYDFRKGDNPYHTRKNKSESEHVED